MGASGNYTFNKRSRIRRGVQGYGQSLVSYMVCIHNTSLKRAEVFFMPWGPAFLYKDSGFQRRVGIYVLE